MIRSLRGRLLLGTSLAAIVVLGLLGFSVYFAMRHALMRDFDESLNTQARIAAGMIDQDGAKLSFDFDPQQMPEFISDARERYFEIWSDDGSVLGRSPSLGSRDLQKPSVSPGNIADTNLPDSHSGHVVVISYSPLQEEHDEKSLPIASRSVLIAVAGDPDDAERTLTLLGWLLTTFCAAAVVIMGVILVRVVGNGTKPIRTLATEIDSLSETDLARRVPLGAAPTELIPVVDKLNGLLTRLDQAFTREKAFTADVAHELRTPLAGLRSTLEVCRSRPRDAAAYEAALDECRGITDRMEAMVQSLLLLARSDAGQVGVERREFDICQLVSQSWFLFQYRALRRQLKVVLQLPATCPITSDADKLQIVLQNVFDNAVSYADESGQIRISVIPGGNGATIEIANTGSAIRAEDVPRLFERFWRGDAARTDSGAHCGLGLSLSQRVMSLIGGEVKIQTSIGGEFIVTLTVG